jgi:hypothetical protein
VGATVSGETISLSLKISGHLFKNIQKWETPVYEFITISLAGHAGLQ